MFSVRQGGLSVEFPPGCPPALQITIPPSPLKPATPLSRRHQKRTCCDPDNLQGDRTLAKKNYSFEKRQKELAKKKKTEEKKQRKLEKRKESDETMEPLSTEDKE
ncbi:MAG: hypothetical protein ACYCYR_01940 [Desulfobulbaceae bacterium]